jgi:hypothetical protein
MCVYLCMCTYIFEYTYVHKNMNVFTSTGRDKEQLLSDDLKPTIKFIQNMNKTINKEIKSLSPNERNESSIKRTQSTVKSPSYSPVKRSVYISRVDGKTNTDNGLCASQPKVIIPTTMETSQSTHKSQTVFITSPTNLKSPLYPKNGEYSPSQPSGTNLSRGNASVKTNTMIKLFSDENIEPTHNFQNISSPTCTSNPSQIEKTTPLANARNLSPTLYNQKNSSQSPSYQKNGENTPSLKVQLYLQNLKNDRSPLRDKTNSPNNISPKAVRTLTRTKNHKQIDSHISSDLDSTMKLLSGYKHRGNDYVYINICTYRCAYIYTEIYI